MIDHSHPSQPNPGDQYIEYHLRPDDIHVFNFLGNRSEGVSEWARHMDVIVEEVPVDGIIRQFLDVQHGVPTLSHMLTEIRGLVDRHPKRAPSRVAVIHSSSMSAALLSALLPLLPIHNTTVRYFKADEQDAAIAWLLKNE
jgi:hypothetical protein